MGNNLPPKIANGTIGELFVQLRLLEHDIQAAPPLKDTGNDLIGIKGEAVRYIQVKTISKGKRFNLSKLPKVYHIVALVKIVNIDKKIDFNHSEIFLLKKEDIKQKSYSIDVLKKYSFKNVVNKLWF